MTLLKTQRWTQQSPKPMDQTFSLHVFFIPNWNGSQAAPQLSYLSDIIHHKCIYWAQNTVVLGKVIINFHIMQEGPFKAPFKNNNSSPQSSEYRRSNSRHHRDSGEDSFQPEYHQIKKMGLKLNKKKLRIGGWAPSENEIYVDFMKENIEDFLTEKSRRTSKVFYRLSKIMKKRTPDQCRSHHQKLQMKHGDNVEAIIEEIQKKIHKSITEQYLNERVKMQFNQQYHPLLGLQKKLPERTAPDLQQQPPKTLMKDWCSVRRTQNTIRIEIMSQNIEAWVP